MKILVSGCLLGHCCRYDGKHMRNEKVIEYLKDKEYIVICPEVMSGMTTPRHPSEIVGDKVMSNTGVDVTDFYEKGAQIALELALKHQCTKAILKEYSPSCGVHSIYDGSFSGKKIKGRGRTTQLLIENGIEVISSEDFVDFVL